VSRADERQTGGKCGQRGDGLPLADDYCALTVRQESWRFLCISVTPGGTSRAKVISYQYKHVPDRGVPEVNAGHFPR